MKRKLLVRPTFILLSCLLSSCVKYGTQLVCENPNHYHVEEYLGWCIFFQGHYGEDFDSALDSVAHKYGIDLANDSYIIEKDTIHFTKHPDLKKRTFFYIEMYQQDNMYNTYRHCIIDTKGDVYRISMRD